MVFCYYYICRLQPCFPHKLGAGAQAKLVQSVTQAAFLFLTKGLVERACVTLVVGLWRLYLGLRRRLGR